MTVTGGADTIVDGDTVVAGADTVMSGVTVTDCFTIVGDDTDAAGGDS